MTKLIISREVGTLFPTHCELLFDKSNLIYSNKNSVGKTTLIRFLLFALGFKIPSTKFVNMMLYETDLEVIIKEKKYIVHRFENGTDLKDENGSVIKHYYLENKEERDSLLMFVFELQNINLIKPLLGVFYVDQDNGWELSNKGIVIQYNKFDVLDLVSAFIDNSVNDVDAELIRVRQDISKYSTLLKLLNVEKKEIDKQYVYNDSIFDGAYVELKSKQSFLISKKNRIEKIIKKTNDIIEDNTNIVNNIELFNILVKKDGLEPFILKKDDIYHFNINNDILLSQLNDLKAKLNEINHQLSKIRQDIKKVTPMISVSEVSNNAVASLREANISEESLSNIILELKKEQSALKDKRSAIIKNNQTLYQSLSKCILKRIRDLGHYDKVLQNDLLTTNAQLFFSGTELHDICFAYNLGCIDFFKEKTGVTLPIILDSPGSGERVIDNLNKLINYLMINYSDHQIIISTTNNINQDGFAIKTELNGYALDGAFKQYQ